MVDFNQETRKRCRNPKCKMKLPEPVIDEREAFCCRGCYQSFYLHRCIACEGKIERTTANRKICTKKKTKPPSLSWVSPTNGVPTIKSAQLKGALELFGCVPISPSERTAKNRSTQSPVSGHGAACSIPPFQTIR